MSEVKGVVYILDAETGRTLHQTEALQGPVRAVDFSPDGRRLLVATGNEASLRSGKPTVGVYDPASGSPLTPDLGHEAAVIDGAFSHDGRAAATGFDDVVRIWDAESGQDLLVLGRPPDPPGVFYGLAWSPDDTLLAASHKWDNSVWIYQTRDGNERQRLHGLAGNLLWLAFSRDGRRLASTDDAGTLKIWDVVSGNELMTLHDHVGTIYDLEFSRDGRFLASAGPDGKVRVRSAGQWPHPRPGNSRSSSVLV